MAKFKSKVEQTYEVVLSDPAATPGEKLKAAELLEKYKTQRRNIRRHTRAKKLLGIGAKEAKRAANTKISDEVSEHLKGTQFALEIFPMWPKEKREFWLKVWRLEK